ncbi:MULTISPECIES: excisionase family DNA-binding protein [Henriciella]|uniref:excisionase family DNA-binding protein n=1 Tax=Henriciella TaxID=453849 RepID=UPI0035112ADE
MTTPGAYAHAIGGEIPSEDMQASAAQLREILAAREGQSIEVVDDSRKRETITLAPGLSKLLRQILIHIERGEGVTFVPNSKQLTTQQAADILNVSRPYLIKLLETDQIAFSMTGRHRRIEARDLFAFKHKRDAQRDEKLDELIDDDRDLY